MRRLADMHTLHQSRYSGQTVLWRVQGLRTAAGVSIVAVMALLIGPTAADAQEPPILSHGLSYMMAFGPKNYPVVSLLWRHRHLSGSDDIIGILVLVGALSRGTRPSVGGMRSVPLERSGSGLPFIVGGIIVTVLLLIGSAIWNFVVLADVAVPARNAAAISGHRASMVVGGRLFRSGHRPQFYHR